MWGPSFAHRCLKWTVRTLAGLFVLVALLAAGILLYASHAREPLIRYLAERSGRQIQVDGAFEAHFLSLHPRVVAQGVHLGNPPWMPPGPTAEIGRLSLVFDLPLFGRSFGIRRLEMDGATLHLIRDGSGRSNWQWTASGQGGGKGLPLIRSLSVPNAQVELDDARRHLRFRGRVSARDGERLVKGQLLEIRGAGTLNDRAATFAINGDPLATVRRDQPYRFAFEERSSGSRLRGRGWLPRPFSFRASDTHFEAVGEDMKDLYFLVGVSLPDTGRYTFTGELIRDGDHFKYSDLAATTGQSDMRGTLLVDTSSGRAQLDADLHSQLLRLADLGKRAAGRLSPAPVSNFVLPDTPLRLSGLRRSDSVVNFHARDLEAGHVALHAVAARLTIHHGVLEVTSASAALSEGRITGHGKVDATHDVLTGDLDLKITDLQLDQFGRKAGVPPPFAGPLRARITLSGHGKSIHELAATSNGTVTAVLPHGAIRASFAELAGLDLARGVGLVLTRNKEETGVRCGVASFQAHDGVLTAQSLLVDTDPVLITGEGEIHLDSEALDLKFRGRPKSVRVMRIRAPLRVRGSLRHSSISLEAGQSAVQVGEAVALGILLTPVAAVLAFVDPGLAKDADCAALLAQTPTSGPRPEARR